MAKTDKGLLFFYDWKIAFEALSGDDCKALLLAMLDYKQNGTQPPEFEGSAKIAAAFIFPAIDRSIKCADAGRSGGLKTQNLKADSDSASSDASRVASTTKQNKNKTKTKQKQDKTCENMAASPPSARTQPPTLDEIRAYCRERQSTVSAEAFFDFYSANGWTQGRGKPIKDWKAAVRTWERRDRDEGKRIVPAENNHNEIILPF